MNQDLNPTPGLITAILTAIVEASPAAPTDRVDSYVDVSATADALMSVLAILVEADPFVKDGDGQRIGADLGKAIGLRIDAARTLYGLTGHRVWQVVANERFGSLT